MAANEPAQKHRPRVSVQIEQRKNSTSMKSSAAARAFFFFFSRPTTNIKYHGLYRCLRTMLRDVSSGRKALVCLSLATCHITFDSLLERAIYFSRIFDISGYNWEEHRTHHVDRIKRTKYRINEKTKALTGPASSQRFLDLKMYNVDDDKIHLTRNNSFGLSIQWQMMCAFHFGKSRKPNAIRRTMSAER